MKRGDKVMVVKDDTESAQEEGYNLFHRGTIVELATDDFTFDIADVKRTPETDVIESIFLECITKIPDELLNEDLKTILLYLSL